jgi:hypothetical protein
LAVEPPKGYLDLDLVVKGYALVQGRPGVCHGGRALGVLLLSFLWLRVGTSRVGPSLLLLLLLLLLPHLLLLLTVLPRPFLLSLNHGPWRARRRPLRRVS